MTTESSGSSRTQPSSLRLLRRLKGRPDGTSLIAERAVHANVATTMPNPWAKRRRDSTRSVIAGAPLPRPPCRGCRAYERGVHTAPPSPATAPPLRNPHCRDPTPAQSPPVTASCPSSGERRYRPPSGSHHPIVHHAPTDRVRDCVL